MLEKAGANLSEYRSLSYIRANFDEILNGSIDPGVHDAFISAQAIHHLDLKKKASLFRLVSERLSTGGVFVNIDVVLPPSDALEKLYFELWAGGMQQMAERSGMSGFDPSSVIQRYQSPESSNRPDTLHDQLDALRGAGFVNVDCFYKNGIFAVFGGQKE